MLRRAGPGGRCSRVVAAAEHALRERAVGDDQPVVRLRVRHVVLVRAAVQQAVLHLVRQHRTPERGLGAAQRFAEKLLTPTWRTKPAVCRRRIPSIVADTGTTGLGQCTW